MIDSDLIPGLNHASEACSRLNLDLHQANEMFSRYGITRLAELTGLDQIGVPVWCCTRPKSLSFSVSFGKGIDASQAQISALLEASENYFAESKENLTIVRGSLNDLNGQNIPVVNLEKLPRCRLSKFDNDQPIEWVRGRSHSTGSEIFAPFDLVGLNYFQDISPRDKSFFMTTIGLGAGMREEDAIYHALLELLEHDAVCALEQLPVLSESLSAVSFGSGVDPMLDDMIRRFETNSVSPVFRIVSEQLGCPVVMCAIPRFSDNNDAKGKICAGFSCRANAYQSALHALLEAAQIRMTLIAGAREDLEWSHYETAPHFDLSKPSAIVPFEPNSHGPEINNLDMLTAFLRQKGVGELSIFNLSGPQDPIKVVRVLAEGLDVNDPEYSADLGARAIDLLLNLGRNVR